MTPARPGLSAHVRTLLGEAVSAYHERPAEQLLSGVARQLDGPLRVAIAGRVKSGKSTLLNALVGTRVAATDAGECTRVVTWYARGDSAQAIAHPRSGPPTELVIVKSDGRWAIDIGPFEAEQLNRIEVTLPSEWLDKMVLADTPGMGSLTEAVGHRTQDFLGQTGRFDAVLYLMRHLHSCDVDFLDTFHEASAGGTSPVNAVGVLSRADEIGGGDAASIDIAMQVAAGYRADSRIRGLVHTVLPVAGLLAESAATLTEAEMAELRSLAAVDGEVLASLLLSAQRFVAPSRFVTVGPETRSRLLDLLGMYGMRFCLDIIRGGTDTVDGLRAALHEHSGLGRLRRLLLTQFTERRDVLKADGALRAIETVLRTDPIPAAPRLRQSVERLRTSAHELAELRLLTDLRLGAIAADAQTLAAMERVVGGEGTSIGARLGVAPDAPTQDVQPLVTSLHRHWRRVALNPLTDPALSRAARVLQRTCEGLAAALQRAESVAEVPSSELTQVLGQVGRPETGGPDERIARNPSGQGH